VCLCVCLSSYACVYFLLHLTILFTQSVNGMRLMTVRECRIQGERRAPTAERRAPSVDCKICTSSYRADRAQDPSSSCIAFPKSHDDGQHHGQCAPHERAGGNIATHDDGQHHGSAHIATHGDGQHHGSADWLLVVDNTRSAPTSSSSRRRRRRFARLCA
jgi:hypothetical protein